MNVIDIFRWCGFAILALVSLFFIYNLSISLAVESIEKLVIVAGALGLEFFKLFSIISATTYGYVGKQLGIKVRKRAWLYFTYVWVSIYSIGASFGYSITAVDRMQSTITILNHDEKIANEKDNILNDNETIKEYKNTKTGYENSKVNDINKLADQTITSEDRVSISKDMASLQRKSDDLQAKIQVLMDKRQTSQDSIDSMKKDDLGKNQVTKRTMFDVIHDTIKVPAKTIAFIILLVFSTSVELGIFTMAPHANKIDNLVVGEEETITNAKKKKRTPQKKGVEVDDTPEIVEEPEIQQSIREEPEERKEDVVEQENEVIDSAGADVPEQIEPIIGTAATSKEEAISIPKETQVIKMGSKSEEILQSLDEDRPTVSEKVRNMLIRL